MKKLNVENWETAENISKLLDQSKLLYCKVSFVSILIVMFMVSFPIVVPYQQQQIMAQEQQQQKQSVFDQTAFDIKNPIKDLSFEINNVTFSRHTASVNGIQMHYVIGGQGDPVVLLNGWPQT
jgi:hypothetical protein